MAADANLLAKRAESGGEDAGVVIFHSVLSHFQSLRMLVSSVLQSCFVVGVLSS